MLIIIYRYFTDGCSFKSLSLYFLKGKSTIWEIVYETCQILWEVLQLEFMPRPNTEKWLEVAQRYLIHTMKFAQLCWEYRRKTNSNKKTTKLWLGVRKL